MDMEAYRKEISKKVNKPGDHRGTTMISVIISFALLLLLVTSYFKVQKMATEMMMNSKDMIVNNSQLIKDFYLGETQNQTVAEQIDISFRGEEGEFYIQSTLKSTKEDGYSGTIYYFDTQAKEP